MWVWNGFLSLFLLLSLFFSCHLSGPQIYWHDMSKCSVCTLCIFFLSFSYLLLWHLLVCGWFILIYFILFWFILFLYFCYGLVCKFFFLFLSFFLVGGGCVSLQVHGMHIHNVLKVSSLSPYPWMHDCQCAMSKRNLKNKKYQLVFISVFFFLLTTITNCNH